MLMLEIAGGIVLGYIGILCLPLLASALIASWRWIVLGLVATVAAVLVATDPGFSLNGWIETLTAAAVVGPIISAAVAVLAPIVLGWLLIDRLRKPLPPKSD